jgi:mono/diheme cytochrome c family protein
MKKTPFGLVLAATLAACATEPAAPPPPTGAMTFATHCAACHGAQAEGDGPVASTMLVTVPNLRTLSQRNGGEFPAEAVASYIDGRDLPAAHGDRLMPVWGGVFDATQELVVGAADAETRIAAVIDFLREIQY